MSLHFKPGVVLVRGLNYTQLVTALTAPRAEDRFGASKLRNRSAQTKAASTVTASWKKYCTRRKTSGPRPKLRNFSNFISPRPERRPSQLTVHDHRPADTTREVESVSAVCGSPRPTTIFNADLANRSSTWGAQGTITILARGRLRLRTTLNVLNSGTGVRPGNSGRSTSPTAAGASAMRFCRMLTRVDDVVTAINMRTGDLQVNSIG